MKGKIVKGISGFYYVHVAETGIYECKAKGIFRNQKIKPLVGTPGFSSMDLPGFSKEDLWTCYPEFVRFEPGCRFIGCSHIGEPDCGVKTALAEGKISQVRYDNYVQLYQEMKNMRKY